MEKVKFIRLREWGYAIGYTVEVDGNRVGTLVVEKMGWKQFDAKRGTPSQTWKFISVDGTNIQADYFKDIKAKVKEIYNFNKEAQ